MSNVFTLSTDSLRSLDAAQFGAVWDMLEAEKRRRDAMENSGLNADRLIYDVRHGLGLPVRCCSEEWIAPTAFHEAYAKDEEVTFEGQRYRSLAHANLASPSNAHAWARVDHEVEIN